MTGQARGKEKHHDYVDVYRLFTQPIYNANSFTKHHAITRLAPLLAF